MTEADEFTKARGAPPPRHIWLIYTASGQTVWHASPDPEGEGEPSAGYVLIDAGQSAAASEVAALREENARLQVACAHWQADIVAAKREIAMLQDIIVTYGDRVRMATVHRADWQQAIDRAFDREQP
jgi:hypothetical protein